MNIYNRPGPNSELLRTFCTVAKLGNVTQAAVALAKTQSAISVKIKQLEDQLSVSLFKRMARGVELTDDGNRLLPIAQKALLEIDRAGDLFSNHLVGRIRIGIPDDYNETILEHTLAQFCSRHSEVEVSIRSGCTSGYPDLIEKEELDLAIYSGMPGSDKNAFITEPTVWVASHELEVDGNSPIPLAVFDRNCRWKNVPTDTLDKVNRKWRIVYTTENYSSYKAAIRTGLAIGVLTKSAVKGSMRILGKKEGLPTLPVTSRVILKNKNAASNIIQEMESAILNVVT